MRFIFSIVKNIIAVLAIIAIIYIALKYAPFLRDQEWNPLHESTNYIQQNMHDTPANNRLPAQPKRQKLFIKRNDIINNVPSSQIKMYLI